MQYPWSNDPKWRDLERIYTDAFSDWLNGIRAYDKVLRNIQKYFLRRYPNAHLPHLDRLVQRGIRSADLYQDKARAVQDDIFVIQQAVATEASDEPELTRLARRVAEKKLAAISNTQREILRWVRDKGGLNWARMDGQNRRGLRDLEDQGLLRIEARDGGPILVTLTPVGLSMLG